MKELYNIDRNLFNHMMCIVINLIIFLFILYNNNEFTAALATGTEARLTACKRKRASETATPICIVLEHNLAIRIWSPSSKSRWYPEESANMTHPQLGTRLKHSSHIPWSSNT